MTSGMRWLITVFHLLMFANCSSSHQNVLGGVSEQAVASSSHQNVLWGVSEQAVARLLKEFAELEKWPPSKNVTSLTSDEFVKFVAYITAHAESFVSQVIGDCLETTNGSCARKAECPGTSEIFQYFVNGTNSLDIKDTVLALPIALYSLTSTLCTHGVPGDLLHKKTTSKPTQGQAWLYGFLFVTSVVIISNIGAFLGPIMDKPFFKRLLQFLVALGAGSLAATGLLVLIPESFDIMSVEELDNAYIWKSTVVIISVYVFFTLERVLKTYLTKRKKSRQDQSITVDSTDASDMKMIETSNKQHEHGHGSSAEDRRTLAWMVMSGDVIHNFVDGLSIGAAFTYNISTGISVSLAVICEELPHELADIAILLHSGMTMKKSLLINFLSACVCYLGLVLGILLGSNIDEASKWIFAMAGGLFLYVPLVDMLPEMSAHLDQLMIVGGHEVKIVAALHSLGLAAGTAVIVFIVNISHYINVD